ncbi:MULTISPECIES: hypothetical protein [Rhizobium]|uniref:hypothetical protein n=1 Tax=Rhizobium TaxID=379 RepID=UPI001C942D29|nr:hypothetical protein [Rhizobium leguminosarum]MBY5404442.1 hypothetical protein [Rhizobium leguminosarum]
MEPKRFNATSPGARRIWQSAPQCAFCQCKLLALMADVLDYSAAFLSFAKGYHLSEFVADRA